MEYNSNLTYLPCFYYYIIDIMEKFDDIAEFFFEKGPDFLDGNLTKNLWKCKSEFITTKKCAKPAGISRLKSSGWTYLKNYLNICIPSWRAIYETREREVGITGHVTADVESRNIYSWIDLLDSENLPFNHVDKPKVRKYSIIYLLLVYFFIIYRVVKEYCKTHLIFNIFGNNW
jgi:hypothetical protein